MNQGKTIMANVEGPYEKFCKPWSIQFDELNIYKGGVYTQNNNRSTLLSSHSSIGKTGMAKNIWFYIAQVFFQLHRIKECDKTWHSICTSCHLRFVRILGCSIWYFCQKTTE